MFKHLVFVCTVTLTLVAPSFAMDHAQDKESKKAQDAAMVQIKTEQQIKSFADKVVVYQSADANLVDGTYLISENPILMVGYIDKEPDKILTAHQLYKLMPCGGYCPDISVIREYTIGQSLLMREPTHKERADILEALNKKHARFLWDGLYGKRIMELLQQK